MTILFGLTIGSFLNVCIVRIPRRQSIITPPSHCPNCEATLRWWHNIPLISFILLKGHCYFCGQRISNRYPLIEALTAVLLLGLFLQFNWSADFFFYLVLTLLLIPIAMIDLEHFLIFDIISIPGIILGLVLALVLELSNFTIYEALLGSVIGAGTMLMIRFLGNFVFKKDTMGFGDVKLAGLIGAFLGWQLVLLSIFGAAILIVMIALIQVLFKKTVTNTKYPYGFYFSIAAILGIFFGDEVIQVYLNFIFQTN